MTSKDKETYSPLTLKLMIQLAAPHTWPAAILPSLLGSILAIYYTSSISVTLSLDLLLIVILMQSGVNTINDYFDFVKGADTKENQVDANDAVLVFNNVNPKRVKLFAIMQVVFAFLLGIYPIYAAGVIPLILGVIGALVIYFYSGGKTPISYLPIGEFASGFTMGTLILFATYFSLTGDLNFIVLVDSIPLLIGIGLILMTNNTCDIEKDITAERKTFSAVVGREKAKRVYHGAFYTMVLSVCLIVLIQFSAGFLTIPFFLLCLYPFGKALLNNPLKLETRVAAMSQILTVNVVVGAFFTLAIIASKVCVLVL